MTEWLGLAGKHALVVGVGGFGEVIVRDFLAHGASVSVADIDTLKLDKLARDLGGAELTTFESDVTSVHRCLELVGAATEAHGSVDVLVHAVGVNHRVPIEEIDPDEFERMYAVNTSSCLWLARAVAPSMRARRSGRIVVLSSVSGLLAHPNHGAYAASKGALNQLMKVMAVEWAADGLTVNAVAPGYALTPLTEAYCAVPGHTEELVARIPMARLASAQDVAAAVLFFASAQTSYITGQVLYVDGGRTLD